MGFNIAIDGPAGAGKSTIAKRAARELAFVYVDTGALYRALAVFLADQGIAVSETTKIEEAVKKAVVSIRYDGEEQQVLVNGENITARLRTEEAGNMASAISKIGAVRKALLDLQRNLAREHDVIMDGRDIGTEVLPEAELKIYLTASVKTRAQRRFTELSEKGEKADLSRIEADIRKRDEQDMTRSIAPLKQAEDAVYLDTSQMNIDEVVQKIKELFREKVRSWK